MKRDPVSANPSGTDPANRSAASIGQRLAKRAFEEFCRFLVLFLYLWVLFGLFVLYERIILKQNHLDFAAHGFALINALVLAKVMLIAEALNLGRWLDNRPLIYRILHDSLLFAVLFIVFHVAEHAVIGWLHGETLAASIPSIGGGGLVGVICVGVILFFALMPYFARKGLSLALGPGRMSRLLFGTDDRP